MLNPSKIQSIKIAKVFALGLITLFCSQSIITDPKYGFVVSQICILLELFEKQYEDNIKKGVVGKRGKKAPIIPNNRLIHPIVI
ncbi:MAG: hypothetical protein N4A33_05545 [Bacteriovoracaceae bacterium]|jgi:hypothetical protein|nr:hypothetical protein [Bacteriovoracaceae bacterium]